MINLNAMTAMGGIIVVLGGVSYFLYTKNVDLNESIVTLQQNVNRISEVNDSMVGEIDSLIRERKEAQLKIKELSTKINKITVERDISISKLDDFRNRLGKVSQKRPELIGNRATSATNRVLWDFACSSGNGNKNRCSGTVPSTSSDSDN